jgi:hypothetical protein
MATLDRLTVEERIRNGYSFDLGKYLNEGFKIFGKEWLMFSLYGLVAFLILGLSIFTIVGFIFLLYPTLLGFSVAADKVVKGEPLNFNDFFGAYKNFGSHAVLGLIFMFIYGLMIGPYMFIFFYAIQDNNPSDSEILGMGVGVLIMLVMMVFMYVMMILLFFAPYLIHYGNYSSSDAIKKSIALSKKNFWWILLLVIITGFISGIGQYACIIGMFATFPIAMLINYSLVKDVLLTGEYSEIDQIGNI